jgi:TonB family protein
MKRLGLFFLLSVMTVFGAIVSMEPKMRLKTQAEEADTHRCVTLTLHAPAKPEPKPVKKAEPEPKPKNQVKPKPKPKPAVKPEPKPLPKPAPVQKPVSKPEPEKAHEAPPLPQEVVKEQPQPAPAASQAEPSPQQSTTIVKALEDYYSRLYRQISENRRYPVQARRFGIEGKVGVAFEIDDSGAVVGSSLLKPSGNPLLDRESMQIFRRISRFEAPPPGLGQRRFEVTIAYTLKH